MHGRSRSLAVLALIGLAAVAGAGATQRWPGALAEAERAPSGSSEWPGFLRTGPIQVLERRAAFVRIHDARDAPVAATDIVGLRYRPDQLRWSLELAGWPPPAETLDPSVTVLAYGLTLDTDADGIADYVLGVDNDALRPGDFRAWLTDLAAGITEETMGGPYGEPVDFLHPDEQRALFAAVPGRDADPPTMSLNILDFAAPPDVDRDTIGYYAWTSLAHDRRVSAWDYAPDVGWLSVKGRDD